MPNEQTNTAQDLPRYIRFHDLKSAGIVANWQTLRRLTKDHGFPVGLLLSPNIRAWDIAEVQSWIAKRPTARKVVPRRKR
jgi:predicted DNA-binding transcriptional regulator AlpA